MPDLICLSCFYDLETAYRFRTNCESSDAILKSFIDTDVLGDQPILQQLVEPDLVDSADQSIVELMADDKSIIMELSDPIQSDADGDGDADDAPDILPSDPTTTATNGLIPNDSIIQGLEFLEGDGGMMKLKVLGQDEYVEYHVVSERNGKKRRLRKYIHVLYINSIAERRRRRNAQQRRHIPTSPARFHRREFEFIIVTIAIDRTRRAKYGHR